MTSASAVVERMLSLLYGDNTDASNSPFRKEAVAEIESLLSKMRKHAEGDDDCLVCHREFPLWLKSNEPTHRCTF